MNAPVGRMRMNFFGNFGLIYARKKNGNESCQLGKSTDYDKKRRHFSKRARLH